MTGQEAERATAPRGYDRSVLTVDIHIADVSDRDGAVNILEHVPAAPAPGATLGRPGTRAR